MAQHQFQTEVSRLLHLIIHSLYSNREVFLRELISNASDALDKLKYLSLSDDAYRSIPFDPRIDIAFDSAAKTLSISDNGIGMNEADLIESLGTIARSGTRVFLERLAEDAQKNSALIGQFGVGFYSAFMVADRIEVLTRKAGEDAAWKWVSDGKESYEITGAIKDTQGTTVLLHLNDEGAQYADRWSIERILRRYSNHIAFPIFLTLPPSEAEGKKKGAEPAVERINTGTALWRRSKTELSDTDYRDFYKDLVSPFGAGAEDPLFYVHTKAEGSLEYTTLFYVPQKAPFDLYRTDYQSGVKLYVKRVFITDDGRELLPPWLRFVHGIIDSEDLPLNVSRELLQQNRVLAAIKNASVKKLLAEFKALADNGVSGSTEAKETWETFITQYNRPLKEGLYQDFANRESLLELVRFKSSVQEGWTSLAAYTDRMREDQKYIYYITGGDERALRASPLLEAYRSRGIEVLIMGDEIDELLMPSLGQYRDKELKGVNRAGADEELGEKPNRAVEEEFKPVITKIKRVLGDRVKEVKLSRRLQDAPSCIVADESDPSMQMAQMLKALGQQEFPEVKPILEVNGEHPMVASLKETEDEERIADMAEVLLGEALLAAGIKLETPVDFVTRLNRLLAPPK